MRWWIWWTWVLKYKKHVIVATAFRDGLDDDDIIIHEMWNSCKHNFLIVSHNSFTCSFIKSSKALWCISELEAFEADKGNNTEADGVPSYLQPNKQNDYVDGLILPSKPIGQTGALPAWFQFKCGDPSLFIFVDLKMLQSMI